MNIHDSIEKFIDKEMVMLLREAGNICHSSGERAFLVGGAVRDILLNIPATDIDVMVQGDPKRVVSVLSRKVHGEIIPHGSFGTVKLVLENGKNIDFATARTEYYPAPGALPVVSQSTMDEDLKRRDFSINAIAASLSPDTFGEVVDKFSGLEDVENRQIRILHDLSFRDDPTRIFRAVKFAGRLGFNLEKKTEELLKDALRMGAMKTLTGSRIKKELQLISCETDVHKIVKLMNRLNIGSAIQDGMKFNEAVFSEVHDTSCINNDDSKWRFFLAATTMNLPDETAIGLTARLSLEKFEKHIVSSVISSSTKIIEEKLDAAKQSSEIVKALYNIPEEAITCFHIILKSDLKSKIEIFKTKKNIELDISGNDLLEIGFAKNGFLGETLSKLRNMKIDGEIRTRDEEIIAAREMLEEAGEKQL